SQPRRERLDDPPPAKEPCLLQSLLPPCSATLVAAHRLDGNQQTIRRPSKQAKLCSVPVLTFVCYRGGLVYECQNQRDTSAHFPKFVIHRSTHFHELRKAMGTSKLIYPSAAFLFEVPGSNSPLAVQELQIGGTSKCQILVWSWI